MNLKYYMFELPDQKKLKSVIRRLPEDHDTSEFIVELSNQKLIPTQISPVRRRGFNTNFPLFLVIPPKTRENAAIYGLTSIGYYKVTAEALRRKGSPRQCFK
ncbi:hypothetical protein AVEN_170381-1 [Araneus ventricosus]|uniref:Pre-C2HC domain-containing protein n=1 Tax=Araneus ventricosus TaxID=182803 RepID=A0A4Y2DTS9_ARAVE|nr:hypothetical protein AVEN_170381-1 [Araneus ventricosus]